MSSTVLGLKEKGACQARPVFIAVCELTYQSQFRSFGGLPISTRKSLETASWMRIAENLHFINLIHAYITFARTCRVVNFDYEINSFVVLVSCGMDLTNLH